MKSVKYIPLVVLLAFAGVGCTSGKTENGDSTSGTQVLPPPIGGGYDPNPPTGTGGDESVDSGYGTNSVKFTPVSLQELNSYVATHPLNYPTNIKVTVDVQPDSEGHVYGQVRISYDDNGMHYEGVFDSGSGTNSNLEYNPFNGWKEYQYNYWMTNTKFSGYFQDPYGAIILVVDGTTSVNQGDGQGGETMLTGSIWYHNFATSQAYQGPNRKCWYIYNFNNPNQYPSTVYDCRSGIMNSKSATNIYPTDSYRKLGTFTGLSKSQAFKQ